MPGTPPDTVHGQEAYAVEIAKCKEVSMETQRKQRKHAFLRFEIEALRELPGKLSWMDWMLVLLIEIPVAIPVVMSCNG